MAKSRRAPSLVVRAPRHASRRLRPVLAAEIRRIAKHTSASTIDLDDKLVANDPTHPLGIASVSACLACGPGIVYLFTCRIMRVNGTLF